MTPRSTPSSSQARPIASASLHPSGRGSSIRPSEARRSTSPSRARCGHLRSRKVQAVTTQGSRPLCWLRRGTRKPVPCRGEVTEPAAARKVTSVTEAYSIAWSNAAASSSWGCNRVAVTGAGVASTTASATPGGPSDQTAQPSPSRSSRVTRADSRMSTPRPRRRSASVRTKRAMPPSRDQNRGGPSGSGAGTSARNARIRPPRRWAAASSGGKTDAADMSSTEPAWMPPIRGSTSMSTTRCPNFARHQRPHGAVADRAPQVRPRQDGVAREAELAPDAEDARARRRPEPRRYAESEPVGQRAEPSAGPHGRAPFRDRDERVGESQFAAQVDRFGPAAQEAVGAHVDGAPPESVAAQCAAEVGRRLEHDDLRCVCAGPGAAGELPRRGQSADAAADDDHPRRRHVRAPRPRQ